MIQTAKWVERTWTFDLPVNLFPNLVERLRGTPQRIEDKIRDLPGAWLTRRLDDKWSVQEHIGHLLDLEPLWFGRLDDFDAKAETLRAADITNRATREANHNATDLKFLLSAFRHARHTLVKRLETYDEEAAASQSLHPRLKMPMRLIDHVQFTCEHDDHHLAKMSEVLHRLNR